jgi:hypothetical protein
MQEPSEGLVPLTNAASAVTMTEMGGLDAEFQCASDNALQLADCALCTMPMVSTTCDGVVKYGYGDKWSEWFSVPDLTTTGSFVCNTATFGVDPYPEHGKICICRPTKYICAAGEKPSSNCVGDWCKLTTTCKCSGMVRYGYGDRWTEAISVKRSTVCGAKKMLEMPDPIPEQDKICQCLPSDLMNQPILSDDTENLAVGGVLSAIIAVILCYFIVYTWLALVRTSNQLANPSMGPGAFERVLEAAATSCVYFAPMLCAIFLAVTKQACSLTLGSPRLYGLPQVWLLWAVGICATAFCGQAITFVLAEWCAIQGIASSDDQQPVIMQTPAQVRTVRFWRTVCNICTGIMYVALVAILIGIVTMQEPASVVEDVGIIPLHAGTVCTIILASAYVLVYLALHIYRNRESASAVRGHLFGLEVFKLAAIAVNFAPMLSILFLGTQIAIDWDGAVLHDTVSVWMYVCTGSVLLQVILVILAPFLANADLQVVGTRGEVDFVTRRHDVFVVVSCIRWIAMAAMYAGVGVVLDTIGFSNVVPAMTDGLCRFAVLYFLAYLVLWIAITATQLSQGGFQRTIKVLGIAKDTVVFCPMLGALFVASFVRAYAITNKAGYHGVPQGFVQDAMLVAAVALAVQLVAVMCAWFFAPSRKGIQGGDGSSLHSSFLICFHFAMGVLYLCVAIVVIALFTINKQNATGEGKVLA